jgi:hypothetical protein
MSRAVRAVLLLRFGAVSPPRHPYGQGSVAVRFGAVSPPRHPYAADGEVHAEVGSK